MATEPAASSRLVLLPSTLLGPAVWEPVADRLRARGWAVQVPTQAAAVTGPEDVLRHLLAEIPSDGPVVLVPHSNAGVYVAALAAECDVRGLVFVDARLPDEAELTPAASAELRAYLSGLADADGFLPGWTRWWPDEDVDALFPDAASRAVVESEQVRLPLAYFDAAVPSPPGWTGLPAAYVAFGDTYAEECAEAERRGWPVERLPGGHLHTLVDPDGVATTLEGLLGQLGLEPPGSGSIRV